MSKKKCTLKIATYNIYNDDLGQEKRADLILRELCAVDADIIGLQEVTEKFFKNYLSVNSAFFMRDSVQELYTIKRCEEREASIFNYSAFFKYQGENEGLAILSRYPFEEIFFLQTSRAWEESNALNVLFSVNGFRFSLTNLHLPWDSARQKEKQITAIDRYIHLQQDKADFFILLGDFNSNLNSSVHRFLLGDQTIDGAESNLYWNDVQSGYCARTGTPMTATLDFIHNPRWKENENIYVPKVTDRIYVMESWYTIAIKEFQIFGTKIFEDMEVYASDHYGITAKLQFEKEI